MKTCVSISGPITFSCDNGARVVVAVRAQSDGIGFAQKLDAGLIVRKRK